MFCVFLADDWAKSLPVHTASAIHDDCICDGWLCLSEAKPFHLGFKEPV